MKMNDKRLQGLAAQLNGYTTGTLKDLLYIVNKVCKLVETNPSPEWIKYQLQPYGEVRNYSEDPIPKVEADLMQKLEDASFFKFQSAVLKTDKIIIGGENGFSGEAAAVIVGDPRSNLEIKYSLGFLTIYDQASLKSYLDSVKKELSRREEERSKLIFYKDGYVEYIPIKGKTSRAPFGKNTNEFLFLSKLVNKQGVYISTADIKLNEPRGRAADTKRRVLDTYKAVQQKLGNGLIYKSPNGYMIDCEVTYKY